MKKTPKEISSFISTLQKNIAAEDNALLLIKFQDNSLASISTSWTFQPKLINHLTIFGEKGTLDSDLAPKKVDGSMNS